MSSTNFEPATSTSNLNSTDDLDNLLISLANIKLPPRNIIIDDRQRSKRDLRVMIQRDIEDNKLAQQKLEKDIVLSRFPCKPDLNIVIVKFCKLFKLSRSDIKFYRHFETTNNCDKEGNERGFHHVKISFKEKSMKLKVISEYNPIEHPIKYSMLCDKSLKNADEDTTISCLSSLSRFNIDISKQLQHLLANRIIKDYKFTNNYFFEFKQNPLASWTTITHQGVIQKWHDLLRSQQNLKLPILKTNLIVSSDRAVAKSSNSS